MCGDANAMAWADAWIGHKPPQAPAPGNHWIETGPHVMVVGAKGMMDGHPRAADPNTAQPYVRWPDTPPYEHLMLPVR